MKGRCHGSVLSFFFALAVLQLLTGCATTPDQPPGDPTVLFQDSFQSAPAAPWSWIRENPGAHRSGESGLQIKIEPGGLMGVGKDARNILVCPLPDGARSVSVGVDTDHKSQYEQAGLNLYVDDDNYIKLVREFVNGETWIVLVVEMGATPKVVNKTAPPRGSTRVGFNFTDRGVTAMCWGDSGELTKVGDAEFPMTPRPRIGVFTQSGQPGADRWATFTDFLISSIPLEGSQDS